MSNTNTEVLTTAYEKLQGALTQSNTVLPKLEEAVEKGNLDNYATTSDLEDIANDCCSHGASPNLADNTSIIQSQLDKKGRVVISKKGTYYVSQLIIDSYTTLELYEGVVLKQLPNTKKYILTNKDYVNGNRCITLIGGEYDNNYEGGNTADGVYKGFGIHLENIRNLNIENVSSTNSSKYAISICKASNVRVNRIYLNTHSDGIHFQPPLKNCVVDTVLGNCGDDVVSFTLGDYSLYRISNEGNFEDVIVRNIEGWCDTNNGQACVKVTGSGLNHAYYFKNFLIENIYGNIVGVNIEDDLYDTTTTDLKLTKIIDFTIRNNEATQTTSSENKLNTIIKSTGGGNIKFEDLKISTLTTKRAINLEKCVLDKLVLNNVYKPTGTNGIIFKNRVNWEWASTIKTIEINGLDYDISESRSFNILDFSYINFDNLYLNNVNLKGSGDINGGLLRIETNDINTSSNIFINNFKINGFNRVFHINKPCTINLDNGIMPSSSSCIAFMVETTLNSSTLPVKVIANGVEGDLTLRHSVQDGTNTCPIKINMNSGSYNEKVERLTPDKYDKVICTTTDTSTQAKGYQVWNGTDWVKLA